MVYLPVCTFSHHALRCCCGPENSAIPSTGCGRACICARQRYCMAPEPEFLACCVQELLFPGALSHCQAKPEPKCGPCSKRQAALAAARKPAVTRTSLHRMSALFTWRSKGCKVFSLHCSETHPAACLGSAHCILLGTVRVILSASLIPLRLQVEVNLMQSRR